MAKLYGHDKRGIDNALETAWRVLGRHGRIPKLVGPIGDTDTTTFYRIKFTIDSYDYNTGIAVCNVEYRPCGVSEVPGETSYGQVEVIDPSGCYFDEDEADLIGRWGDADYMAPDESIDQYQECVWVCSGLCCPA